MEPVAEFVLDPQRPEWMPPWMDVVKPVLQPADHKVGSEVVVDVGGRQCRGVVTEVSENRVKIMMLVERPDLPQ